MTPIFLLSLPRAGSTLLQRVLSNHAEISTQPEPWILLPVINAQRPSAIMASYDHEESFGAISGFCQNLPNGQNDFDGAIREFAHALYEMQSDAEFFLDKTPRYAAIAADIMRVFPDAKFIILWRNPLSVMASMIETWGDGRWNLYRYYVDIYDGLDGLLAASKDNASGVCMVNYEKFVVSPEDVLKEVFSYLDQRFDPEILVNLKENTVSGRLGDPHQGQKFKKISDTSVLAWQNSVKNPLRRLWFRKYIQKLGAANLSWMGYDIDALMQELYAAPVSSKYLFSDACRMIYGYLYRKFNLPLLRKQFTGKNPAVVFK